MFLADMQNQSLGGGQFWRKPVGTLRRFDDLFIDPAADFILWSRHIGIWKGEKAVYRGKAYTIRWYWLIQPIFQLDEVEFLPLNWTYWYRLWSNTHTFRRSLGFIAYLQILGRWNLLVGVEIGSLARVLGWYVMSGRSGMERRGVQPLHVELLPFVSYIQTCDHNHAVASLYCTSLEFWWVSSDCCKEWACLRW